MGRRSAFPVRRRFSAASRRRTSRGRSAGGRTQVGTTEARFATSWQTIPTQKRESIFADAGECSGPHSLAFCRSAGDCRSCSVRIHPGPPSPGSSSLRSALSGSGTTYAPPAADLRSGQRVGRMCFRHPASTVVFACSVSSECGTRFGRGFGYSPAPWVLRSSLSRSGYSRWLRTLGRLPSSFSLAGRPFSSQRSSHRLPPVGTTRTQVLAKSQRLQAWSAGLAGFGALGFIAFGVSSLADLPTTLTDMKSVALWALAGLLAIAWVVRVVAAYYQSQAES